MPQLSLIKEKGITHLNGIDSDFITNLLAEHHSNDVFIPECKNGETWGARDLLKLDAWVLKRTYSPLSTIGYEIKISRQDFEQDQKWVRYTDLCHYFYFVCPAGLIRAVDLPSSVGLIWVSSTNKLHTKRRAERTKPDTEKLNGLLIYALMARSKIVANMFEVNGTEQKGNLTQRSDYLKEATEKRELAYFVKGHIREIYDQLDKKDADIKLRENRLGEFEGRLAKLGITWDSTKTQWQDTMKIDSQIDALKQQIDDYTLQNMERLAGTLTQTAENIRKIKRGSLADSQER